MSLLQRLHAQGGVCTDEEVPESFAAVLSSVLFSAPVRQVTGQAAASIASLEGHALDGSLLSFASTTALASVVVDVIMPTGVSWSSFGALALVTPPPNPSSPHQRIDLYSIFPRGSSHGDLYLGDAYLRLDVASNGRVSKSEFGGVQHLRQSTRLTSEYGTMLYFAALVLSGVELKSS